MDSISAIVDGLLFERDSKNNGGRKVKAILVVDTTKCRGCPFCHESAYYSWCDAPRKERFWEMPLTSKDIEEERTVECPLRPLPARKEVHYTDPLFGEVENLTNIGYNKCLDDLGETE